MILKRIIITALLVLTYVSLAQAEINVFVSVAPLKYFVQRIAGDKVNVHVMVRRGQSPETYTPTPQQMAALQNTQIYFRIGVPFEQAWMHKIELMNPHMTVVDLRHSKGIKLLPQADGVDPHIWNDPVYAEKIARQIYKSLIEAAPEDKKDFRFQFLRLKEDLEALHTRTEKRLMNLHPRIFLVYHPAWGYFAKRYNLTQIPIEHGAKEAGPRDIAHVINMARGLNVHLILLQPEFDNSQAKTIADATGATVETVDPLAESYIYNINKLTNILAKHLSN